MDPSPPAVAPNTAPGARSNPARRHRPAAHPRDLAHAHSQPAVRSPRIRTGAWPGQASLPDDLRPVVPWVSIRCLNPRRFSPIRRIARRTRRQRNGLFVGIFRPATHSAPKRPVPASVGRASRKRQASTLSSASSAAPSSVGPNLGEEQRDRRRSVSRAMRWSSGRGASASSPGSSKISKSRPQSIALD